MNQHNYQLTNKAAKIYETQKVEAIFRPLAEATLREVPIDMADIVLDVACGTGIISRCVAEHYTMANPLVGVDLNEGMIEVAKALTKANHALFEWHQSDVTSLPFDDNSFTIAFCQQGLQFFPKKIEALGEIRRVLKPGGRVVITVWSSISPFFEALAQALGDHINEEIAEQSLAPFAFRDEAVIQKLIMDAGYTQITSRCVTVLRQMGSAETSIPREIASNPVGVTVSSKGQDTMDQIVKQVEAAIQVYKSNTGFVIPQETYLFQANA